VRRWPAALALLGLCLLAGCSVGYQDATGPSATPTDHPTATPTEDRLGWEAGYAANATLSVNATDGLNESEREAVLARTMARVELIRGLEFRDPVSLEVVSRAEYRNRSVNFSGSDEAGPLADQSWEAPFLVGEDRDSSEVLGGLFGSGVVGYYSPDEDAIVVVSDSETPTVNRATLAHELVHAFQDQHLSLRYPSRTRDERLAAQGLTEGDANLVEAIYERRCGVNWTCIDRPSGSPPPAGPIARNPGVYLTLVQPYIVGPEFVRDLRNRSAGWEAVNDAYGTFPAATEGTIHPERYPEDPAFVSVDDRSSEAWERVGSDTLGEVTVHVMFWNRRLVPRPDDAIRTDYDHRLSTGWGNDRLVAYRHTETGEEGYVWRLVWDSPAEAAEFHEGYIRLLRHKVDADRVRGAGGEGTSVHVVDEGPFADAFRLIIDGDTVTVVNAPTVEALPAVGGEVSES
jgi:hypothetical protein